MGTLLETLLMVISLFLIGLVLLQSGKAEATSQIIQGGSADLFSNRKERGGELFVSRLTMFMGMLFFVICLLLSF